MLITNDLEKRRNSAAATRRHYYFEKESEWNKYELFVSLDDSKNADKAAERYNYLTAQFDKYDAIVDAYDNIMSAIAQMQGDLNTLEYYTGHILSAEIDLSTRGL